MADAMQFITARFTLRLKKRIELYDVSRDIYAAGKYRLVCTFHKRQADFRTKKNALALIAHSDQWCGGCENECRGYFHG